MRKSPHIIVLALLLFATAASGQTLLDYRSTDTLWIDSIATHSGQKAILDIFFTNSDTINGFDLPLTYTYPDLMIDSVSFVGSRVESRFITIVEIDDTAAICHIGGFYFDSEEEVGPGSGLLARIHLTVPDNYETRLIPFDTTRAAKFVTKDDASYVPIFERGYVDNTFAPSLDDSVWVDDIDVVPGERFQVGVYGYNQHPVYNISLPLRYESDNIVFDSISVAGTRASDAVVVEGLADDSKKKVMVILRFDDSNLLPSGSGQLAKLHFTCQVTGTTSDVIVDTTNSLFGGYYFQLGQLFSNVKIYPEFHSGNISIDLSTAVDDNNQNILPAAFSLEQNHPNPFNPVTSIAFALPKRSHVVMDVYNILGQNIRRLINESLPAGNHSITFDGLDRDGNELASGVYFYRIKTEDITQSKKMMLMK